VKTTLLIALIGGFIMTASGFSFIHPAETDKSRVRQSVYSGTWYPGTEEELRSVVDAYLSEAETEDLQGTIIGLVAPHAGFTYSAPVAACAYIPLKGQRAETVVLIGNAHREGFIGAAIDSAETYVNPLGSVKVDVELARQIVDRCPSVTINARPHAQEHSLEIQIPFLQRTLGNEFNILPVLFGYDPDGADIQIASALVDLLKNRKALLVASTDLTHYPSWSDAKRIDSETIQWIASMDTERLKKHEKHIMANKTHNLSCVLCGLTATTTVMSVCRELGADYGKILKYANSGDIPMGDRHRVVGYGAIAFVKEHTESVKSENAGIETGKLTENEENMLLEMARLVLTEFVTAGNIPPVKLNNRLEKIHRGAFVTLRKGTSLRGCIGYIEPIKTCAVAVRENTISAAAKDPRFPPVSESELKDITIEISVLTPPEHIESWTDILIGKHGILLEKGRHRSVFLPQVATEQGWDLETTLNHLAQKAGMSPNAWRDGAQFKVFEAQVFHENGDQ
jgi:MEMO1 family protein